MIGTKRRRTAREIEAIRQAIYEAVEKDKPMTVRQTFYRLAVAGVVEKTEAEYKQTVARLLVVMRREGRLPYGWIVDNTRMMRKPVTYSSVEQAVQTLSKSYRRNLWEAQSVYVEIWLEKDALSGVLFQVTREWDVPLMVTRGYPSMSF